MRTTHILLTASLAACAATTTTSGPSGGPRGLRASEHLDLARQNADRVRQDAVWPEPTRMGPGRVDPPVAVPWFRSWNAGDEQRLAEIHRSSAAELEAAYERACGDRPADQVMTSPLVRYGIGGWPTPSGAIVYLSPAAGSPAELLAALNCHRAFMMLAPSDMDDCPLDLPGLELEARGAEGGITVSLSVKDPTLIEELQRRAAHELEISRHQVR